MSCATGFKHNVSLTVNAANGTTVELHGAVVPGTTAGSPLLATSTVTNSQVAFSNVQFPEGLTRLTVEINGVACTPTVSVTVDCNLPACAISAPTHDTLNGAAAPAGDRVSSPGSDYQAAFEVTTDIEDGQPVVLSVINLATPTAPPATVTANAQSGRASFPGVTLKPDGQYRVSAACTNSADAVGHSMNATFTVDTAAPALMVNQPTSGTSFSPADLTNGNFMVCATTTSADAAALPTSGGVSRSNLCVTRGQSTTCTAVATVGTSTCLNVLCPNGAPFDLNVSLFDAAGNTSSEMITGITCTSTLPAVQIVAPLTDAPNFLDRSKRLLSASATQGLKDADGVTAGAQTTVVACTDTMGASAQLLAGLRGGALTALGTPVPVVAAVAADNCPNTLAFVARFTAVTLPDSTEAADGTLTAATEIRVDVTNPTTTTAIGTSGPTDLWVDSVDPTLSENAPTPLCGSTQTPQSPSTAFTSNVDLNSTTSSVTLSVTNGLTTMFGPPTYVIGTPTGVATFGSVIFPQGVNLVIATATEPSGNSASLTPPVPMLTCTVAVGTAPVVSFTAPTSGQNLCASDNTSTTCIPDATPGTPGWQGNITVHVTAAGAAPASGNVTITVAGGAPQTAALDAMGNATLVGATIPDGPAVELTATTASIPGQGTGTNTINVRVDTLPPAAPTGLLATVLNRRETSFTLTWTAPADAGGGTVAGYQIRYAKVPITATNFDTAAVATPLTFGGSAGVVGHIETITVPGLYIENDYYFAVRAVDGVGNVGPLAATVAATSAHFNTTVINSMSGTNEELGYGLNGEGDANGDGFSDVLAGTYQGSKAYLYFGGMTGPATVASVVFSGAAAGFGNTVAFIGDIDSDGRTDLAVSDPLNAARVYIYKGRATWPMTLTDLQADYVIAGDATYVGSVLGSSIAALGDFTGDGVDDFALGARGFGTPIGVGQVVIIPGKAGFASVTLPDAVNAIVINGDPLLGRPLFGYRVLGIGHMYSTTTGTTLIVSAPGLTSNATSNAGRVYAFHGQTGTAGAIPIITADQVIAGPASGTRIGLTLASLGPIVGAFPNVGIGNPVDTMSLPGQSGTGFVAYGTPATGPLANRTTVSFTGATLAGGIIAGGRLSGRDANLSLVGSAAPDLLFGAETNSTVVTISDGALFAAKTAPVDVNATAEVRVPLPAGWVGGEASVSLMADVNGDGYPDFSLGKAFGTIPGAVAVFW